MVETALTSAQLARLERRQFLNSFKEMMGCKDCGSSDGPLQFDHRDKDSKSFQVSWGVSLRWQRLWAEMEKCDVRCAACHIKRHNREDIRYSANAAKTHCLRGHPYDEVNTYINPNGDRICRTCQRRSHRRERRLLEAQKAARVRSNV